MAGKIGPIEFAAQLAATCERGDHWRCNGRFLAIVAIDQSDLEGLIKKWWGSPELWVDFLATETAYMLGQRLGGGTMLSKEIGDNWHRTVGAWLDATFAEATKGMNTPPKRWDKTPALAQRIYLERVAEDAEATLDPNMHREVKEKQCWQWLSSAPLASISWLDASRLEWVHGGSGGVIFLQVGEAAVCVKSVNLNDVFASRFASALGVHCAGLRPLPTGSEEAKTMRSAVSRLAPSYQENPHFPDIQKILKAPLCGAVEFLNGTPMMGMSANAWLLANASASPPWHDIGRMVGFDMLINNFDRLPLVWSNDGNLGNVMLGSSGGLVVGIDQAINPITHPDGLKQYLCRVEKAVAEARDQEGSMFEPIARIIHANTGVEIGPKDLIDMRAGCLELAQEVARMAEVGELEACVASHFEYESLAPLGDEDSKSQFEERSKATKDNCKQLVLEVVGAIRGVLSPPDGHW